MVRFLEAVGRRSLNIFCVHTIELIAIPWYLFVAKFEGRPLLGMWLQYAVSMGSIVASRAQMSSVIKLFPARRRTPAVQHYTARH